MKAFKSFAFGVLALTSSGIANAQLDINFAASNGDRNATQTAIARLLSNWSYRGVSGSLANQLTLGPTEELSATARNSNFGTWRGEFGGETVVIRTNYAGALAGIAAVSGNTTPRFDVTNGLGSGPILEEGFTLLTTTDPNHYQELVVDFGLSTNFQATSPFNGYYNGHTYESIEQENVGISPLGFYASPGFPGDNITSQQAKLLFSTGSIPLIQLTGDPSHANGIVFAIGRNTDAGQRYAAQLEVGLGPGTATVWRPTVVDAVPASEGVGGFTYGGRVTSQEVWPIETHSGITESGGYPGGADLAPALTVTIEPSAYSSEFPGYTQAYYIGYLTPGDADGRVLGLDSSGNPVAGRDNSTRGVKLKYNGVENTRENIKNGKYTLWLYNRILRRSTFDGAKAVFVDALAEQIKAAAETGGGIKIDDPDLKVERFEDGGIVYPLD